MLGRSHTLKSARLKERRRKIIIGKVILAIMSAGGLWGLVFWLAGLPAITISAIEVRGTVSVSSEAITASAEKFLSGRYLFTVPHANILFYPKRSITRDIIELYPRVESAEVKFKNFQTINIAIKERETAALWCRPLAVQEVYWDEKWDDCFLVDRKGLIFDRFDPGKPSSPDVMKFMTSSRVPAYAKFYGLLSSTTNPVGQTYAPERFQELLLLADDMASFGVTVLAFRERFDHDLDVELVGRTRLVVEREPDVSSVISNLQSVISEPNFGGPEGLNRVDYIDMRFGNKVFYRLK